MPRPQSHPTTGGKSVYRSKPKSTLKPTKTKTKARPAKTKKVTATRLEIAAALGADISPPKPKTNSNARKDFINRDNAAARCIKKAMDVNTADRFVQKTSILSCIQSCMDVNEKNASGRNGMFEDDGVPTQAKRSEIVQYSHLMINVYISPIIAGAQLRTLDSDKVVISAEHILAEYESKCRHNPSNNNARFSVAKLNAFMKEQKKIRAEQKNKSSEDEAESEADSGSVMLVPYEGVVSISDDRIKAMQFYLNAVTTEKKRIFTPQQLAQRKKDIEEGRPVKDDFYVDTKFPKDNPYKLSCEAKDVIRFLINHIVKYVICEACKLVVRGRKSLRYQDLQYVFEVVMGYKTYGFMPISSKTSSKASPEEEEEEEEE